MGIVTRLQPEESVRLDLDRLVEIYEDMGATGAEDTVVRAVESIEGQLIAIDDAYRRGRFDAAGEIADDLVGVAGQIGMQSLVGVARGVADCAADGNTAALGATVARLTRIGLKSLHAISDPPELLC